MYCEKIGVREIPISLTLGTGRKLWTNWVDREYGGRTKSRLTARSSAFSISPFVRRVKRLHTLCLLLRAGAPTNLV
jgi:hypothetical protein